MHEFDQWGRLDPSNEKAYTKAPGLEHKYNSTALMLVSKTCEAFCRYCFRKRLFLSDIKAESKSIDLEGAYEYIQNHPEITNILLTGGDPLRLSTSRLEEIIRRLRQIDHVQIIRIGSRMPVFNPYRITEDEALLKMINAYSYDDKKIYIVTHFDHPKEVTDVATKGVTLLQKAGASVTSQMPLIRGVNDNPQVVAELMAKLSFIGIVPYYIFQCGPAVGNWHFTVPIEEGYKIIERAKARLSGLAKRFRYVMSHSTGKIEIVGLTKKRVYFKYLRAADDADSGRFLMFKRNPQAYWFDDYDEVIRDYSINLPYRVYGPE
jgi:KamA family protein